MRRWGEGERFLDRIASIRSAGADGRLPLVVHRRAIRGRPRPITTCSSSGSRRPSWTGWDSSRSATRSAPTPPASRTRSTGPWWPSGSASAPSSRTASPPRRREELLGATVEVLVDAPGEGRTYREAPEIDGIVSAARRPARRIVRRGGGHRRRRPRPGRRTGPRAGTGRPPRPRPLARSGGDGPMSDGAVHPGRRAHDVHAHPRPSDRRPSSPRPTGSPCCACWPPRWSSP